MDIRTRRLAGRIGSRLRRFGGILCLTAVALFGASTPSLAQTHPGTGNQYQREDDYAGPGLLHLSRAYNAATRSWVHNYLIRVNSNAAAGTPATVANVLRPDGRLLVFTGNGAGAWSSNRTVAEQLVRLPEGDASGAAWKFVNESDTTELYDAAGLPLSLTARGGQRLSFQWSAGNGTGPLDNARLLQSVTDAWGRRIAFGYDDSRRLASFSTPAGQSTRFGYDTQGRLASATYPDNAVRSYLYEDGTNPWLLTAIQDEAGQRVLSVGYDSQGRTVATSGAGGTGNLRLAYNADGSTTTTDALGTARTQRFTLVGGKVISAGQSLPCADCIGGAAEQAVDPATGLVTQQTDYLGVRTFHTFNAPDAARKLPTATTRAAGLPEAQTTSVQWHPTLRLPVQIDEAGRRTTLAYDNAGNLTQRTVTDTSASAGSAASRTWKYSYSPTGQVLTATDPANRSTSYSYDASGNLAGSTNALGHRTVYQLDADGRLTSETAANGLVIRYTYDVRGRLLTVTATGTGTGVNETTRYTWQPTGLLASVTQPSGYQITYSYDAAQRLTGAGDNRGNRIGYTLDAMGNRVREEVRDASGRMALATGRAVNALNRVATVQGAQGQTTSLAYDANGNAISSTDPLYQTTRQALDALGRPTVTTFPDNASASQSWNALDQLTQVTDPKGVATRYQRNAFGEVIAETSPDIGTVRHTRDAVGDIASSLDARGQTTQISRDTLGRPVDVRYGDGKLVHLSWDKGGAGAQAGHLRRMEDPSGSTTWERDALGRVTARTQTVNDNPRAPASYRTAYGYAAGELAGITYPSGLKLAYTRDATGRVTAITRQEPGAGKPVSTFLSGASYTGLGQPQAWTWFNGDTANRSFDADGRMAQNEFASYAYDAAGRITRISQSLYSRRTDVPNPATAPLDVTSITWQAAYDNRDRLTAFNRDGVATSYSYDANSNRLAAVNRLTSDADLDGELDPQYSAGDLSRASTQASKMDPASNKLLGFTQTFTRVKANQLQANTSSQVNYTLDASGNLTGDGLRSFTYDASNRLTQVRQPQGAANVTTTYLTNGQGQRVFKSETKADFQVPSEAELGRDFVAWLRATFAALFDQAQANASPSLGTAFVYADGALPSWALLGDYDNGSASGQGRSEYLWLPAPNGEATLVGMYRNNKFFAVHTVHLGTPRLLTDASKQPVWQWPYSGFGENKPTGVLKATANKKAGATTAVVVRAAAPAAPFDLRFPGQIADDEAGHFYNLNRNYSPSLGRYSQGDPVGLDGGLNRYEYGDTNAVSNYDPRGLQAITGFTRHGLNQAINRSVSPSAMLDAVKNPVTIRIMPNDTVRYTGNSAVVVMNPAGRVVTCWSK